MTATITGADINSVLRLVSSLSNDGDAQLSILARAFVVGCRSCGVERETALAKLADIFAEPVDLVSLRARSEKP